MAEPGDIHKIPANSPSRLFWAVALAGILALLGLCVLLLVVAART